VQPQRSIRRPRPDSPGCIIPPTIERASPDTRSGFDYRRPDGSLVRDLETLQRIKSLVIPPAWSAVWIGPDPLGHIQVTGRDQRGRKQYRYHRRWREVRDESKYGKMLTFAQVLPLIRARVDTDLRRHGLPCERVLAAIVRLLELTLFRVGNSEYARANGSFGLTTLRDRHAHIQGSRIQLSFRGKRGIAYETDIKDALAFHRWWLIPLSQVLPYLAFEERHT
jgi:DNA topoisomerase-1